MELMRNKMNKIHPLSDETWNEFSSLLKYKQYPSKHKLCKLGQRATDGYFLIDGFIRVYLISENGVETNKHIYPSGSFVASFTSLILQNKSIVEIECLTECKIVEFNYADFIKLSNSRMDLCIMQRKNLEKFYVGLEKRELEYVFLNSTERYLALIKRIPKIETKISQKNIALHLGITTVQLSRLKRNLRT